MNNNVTNLIEKLNTVTNTASSNSLTIPDNGTNYGTVATTTTCLNPNYWTYSYYPTIVYSDNGTSVKKAKNGYIVQHFNDFYIAKTEKELTKVLINILNPKQTKGSK